MNVFHDFDVSIKARELFETLYQVTVLNLVQKCPRPRWITPYSRCRSAKWLEDSVIWGFLGVSVIEDSHTAVLCVIKQRASQCTSIQLLVYPNFQIVLQLFIATENGKTPTLLALWPPNGKEYYLSKAGSHARFENTLKKSEMQVFFQALIDIGF